MFHFEFRITATISSRTEDFETAFQHRHLPTSAKLTQLSPWLQLNDTPSAHCESVVSYRDTTFDIRLQLNWLRPDYLWNATLQCVMSCNSILDIGDMCSCDGVKQHPFITEHRLLETLEIFTWSLHDNHIPSFQYYRLPWCMIDR